MSGDNVPVPGIAGAQPIEVSEVVILVYSLIFILWIKLMGISPAQFLQTIVRHVSPVKDDPPIRDMMESLADQIDAVENERINVIQVMTIFQSECTAKGVTIMENHVT